MNILKHSALKVIVCLAVVCTLGASISLAAFDMASWPYSRNLPPPYSGPKEVISDLVKFQLPADFKFATSDFSDLRIIDGQGSEVPFLITRSISSQRSSAISAQLINLSSQSDGSTAFIADTGKSGVIRTSISINASSPNFRRQVAVYAADSLLSLNDTRWSRITNTGYIFRFTDPYTGYVSGKDSVEFPSNASRYYKVVISGGPEGSVSVAGASVEDDAAPVIADIRSKDVPVSLINNPQKKSTEVVIDLGTSGYLTNAVTLYPSDSNYSRRVTVETSEVLSTSTASWSQVGQSSISHVSTSVFQGASNVITYPEQRTRYIRISIVNDDNPPLTLTQKATVESPIISGVFENNPQKSYSLYYGNAYASRPQYDITHLSSYIEESTLPVIIPGAEMTNPSYVPPAGPVIPFTESHKILFNILLVIVVIVVGAGIIFYIRAFIKKSGGTPQGGMGSGNENGPENGAGNGPDSQPFVTN